VINSLKAVIRPFIPKPIYQAAHDAKHMLVVEKPAPLLPQAFSPRSSFEEAKREAGVGYSNEDMLAKAHVTSSWLDEMQDYAAPMLASVALASQYSGGDRLNVLDFGGGRGTFRAYVKDFFGDRIQTRWKVVETAEQVNLNANLGVEGFEFSTEIGSEPFDLAIFSGSLQYVDDWQRILRSTNAKYIYISRSPLDDLERPYLQTVIRGERVCQFAARVINKNALFELLSETHELFASWKFEAHLLEMGPFPSPAMLWMRR